MQAACTAMIRSAKASRGGRRAISAPPHTPDTRATRDFSGARATQAPPVAIHRCTRSTPSEGPRGKPSASRRAATGEAEARAPSGYVVSSIVACSTGLVIFVPFFIVSASHMHIAAHRMDISLHDQTPRSVAQLSVSRTTRAHNRTRARSPPLLSIHALHSASGAHTRQRPHRART